ncbi:MAG: hypothetical protein IKF80_06805 [Erysipelotrichaceae bacterium]|nr:hypothetical protein [Erysipelotrichaceae bacterium]
MKNIISILISVAVVLGLCACSVEVSSTSSSSFTTSTTDAQGNTTETTTTTENGVTTTDTITTTADDPTGLRSKWKEFFSAGAEGVSNDGYNIYMIMDDPENITLAAIMVTTPEDKELLTYIYGEVTADGDTAKISDVQEDLELPFQIGESQQENCFEIYFQDGDAAVMELVDQDTIINDMISIWEVHQAAYQEAHAPKQ